MPIPLSWSRISVYRQCPSQFEAKFLTKTYPDESDNPAFEKGTKIHKQLENYILWKKGKKKLEPKLSQEAANAKPIIDHLFSQFSPGSINAEKQIAINHDWKECDWFDAVTVVKFRGIMDMLVIAGNHALIIDFKTGKVRPYNEKHGQLHLSAAIIFELFPEVEVIDNAYLFVEHKQTDKIRFERKDHAANKAHFDVEYLQINEDKEFEPKKNQYCYFCGIKGDCIYG